MMTRGPVVVGHTDTLYGTFKVVETKGMGTQRTVAGVGGDVGQCAVICVRTLG